MLIKLTAEEKKAIAALKRVAAKWPQSLWLFSASGNLCVMRYGPDGKRAMDGSSVDQAYKIDQINNIPNDGGDW
jgi:hypothetical protein